MMEIEYRDREVRIANCTPASIALQEHTHALQMVGLEYTVEAMRSGDGREARWSYIIRWGGDRYTRTFEPEDKEVPLPAEWMSGIRVAEQAHQPLITEPSADEGLLLSTMGHEDELPSPPEGAVSIGGRLTNLDIEHRDWDVRVGDSIIYSPDAESPQHDTLFPSCVIKAVHSHRKTEDGGMVFTHARTHRGN